MGGHVVDHGHGLLNRTTRGGINHQTFNRSGIARRRRRRRTCRRTPRRQSARRERSTDAMAVENPLSSMAQKPGLDSAGESHAQSQLSSGTRAYNNSFKPVANCIPGPNLRCLLVGVHVEGKSLWLAAEGHHLVCRRDRRLLCSYCPSRRLRLESSIVGKSLPSYRSGHLAE